MKTHYLVQHSYFTMDHEMRETIGIYENKADANEILEKCKSEPLNLNVSVTKVKSKTIADLDKIIKERLS